MLFPPGTAPELIARLLSDSVYSTSSRLHWPQGTGKSGGRRRWEGEVEKGKGTRRGRGEALPSSALRGLEHRVWIFELIASFHPEGRFSVWRSGC